MQDWVKFRVGKPAVKGFNSSCMAFNTISHVSHITSAVDIIESFEIRPSLVFDKSVLNDKRILVTWLSPNHWSNGFRYGSVRFTFDFNKVIKGKNAYWVESVAYKIPACRILITDMDRSNVLTKYDPESGDGPWWYTESSDTHYFNNEHCLEFMIESAVSLKDLKAIDFVNHHNSWCSVHRYNQSSCKELGLSSLRAGAKFFARAVMNDVSLIKLKHLFLTEDGEAKSNLDDAVSRLDLIISDKVNYAGDLAFCGDGSIPIAKAVLGAIAYGRVDEAKALASYFCSNEDLYNTICTLIGECFGEQPTFPED